MRHEPRRRAGDDRRPRGPITPEERAAARRRQDRKVETPLPLPKREPTAIRGAIVLALTAIVHVLVLLGVTDRDTEKALVPVIDGVGFVAALVWARYGATANAKVVARVSTSRGAVVAGDAAILPTGTPVAVSVDGQAGTFPGHIPHGHVEPLAVHPALVPTVSRE